MRTFVMTVFVIQIITFALNLAAYLITSDKRAEGRAVGGLVQAVMLATWAGFLLFGN